MPSPCAGKRYLDGTTCVAGGRYMECMWASGPRRSFCRKITSKTRTHRHRASAATRLQASARRRSASREARRRRAAAAAASATASAATSAAGPSGSTVQILENHLLPYNPLTLRLSVVNSTDIDFEDNEREFGFKPRSQQSGFFETTSSSKYVGLLYKGGIVPPRSMLDPCVVARVFGEMVSDDDFNIWHVSVASTHSLNNSDSGFRWGVHNVVRDRTNPNRTKWKIVNPVNREVNVTFSNAPTHVRGTPNPYAAQCLARTLTFLDCATATQKENMPCAKLFVPNMPQHHDASIFLLYAALGFQPQRELHRFYWHRGSNPAFVDSYVRMLARMAAGQPVVPVVPVV